MSIANLTMTNAGLYQVIVSDALGSTTSAPARLEVHPTWTKITTDPIVTDSGYDGSTGLWADLDNDGFVDLFVATDTSGHNPIYYQ